MNIEEAQQWRGKLVTITTRRVDPFTHKPWLGDSIGTVVEITDTTVELRDRGTTMGQRAKSICSIEAITAIRTARRSDEAGVHNDRS